MTFACLPQFKTLTLLTKNKKIKLKSWVFSAVIKNWINYNGITQTEVAHFHHADQSTNLSPSSPYGKKWISIIIIISSNVIMFVCYAHTLAYLSCTIRFLACLTIKVFFLYFLHLSYITAPTVSTRANLTVSHWRCWNIFSSFTSILEACYFMSFV